MFKSIVAGITAVSLTLATAAPLQAQEMDREDVGKLLFGLAAVAVLGAALDRRDERREESRDREEARDERRGINTDNNWSNLNRQSRQNNGRWNLPRQCLRTVETRRGEQRIFGKRCLERNFRHVNRLPEYCAVRVRTTNGRVRGYDPLCLREQGYRSDRRH